MSKILIALSNIYNVYRRHEYKVTTQYIMSKYFTVWEGVPSTLQTMIIELFESDKNLKLLEDFLFIKTMILDIYEQM